MPTTSKKSASQISNSATIVTAPAAAVPVTAPSPATAAAPATTPPAVPQATPPSASAANTSATAAAVVDATGAPPQAAILTAYVEQASSVLDTIAAGLFVTPPALTTAQKQHAGKLRAGGESAVTLIGSLATRYDVESNALQVAPMLLAMEDAKAIAPLVASIQTLAKRANDLLFLWQSNAWTDAMQFYALLQRMGKVDGDLAESLAPVAAFFAKRHTSTKGAVPKRTAKANAKALKRLQQSAPELLAPGVAETGVPTAAAATGNGAGGASGTGGTGGTGGQAATTPAGNGATNGSSTQAGAAAPAGAATNGAANGGSTAGH